MQQNYNDWMKNTLGQEVEDWKKQDDPEVDNDGCFRTSAPIIIYQASLCGIRILYLAVRLLYICFECF